MTDAHVGPRTQAADAIHAMKYRGDGESFREAMNRIAAGLKDSDEHYREFREILLHQRFLPGGRIQTATGSTRQTTSFNCFVSSEIADSYVDGENCIMDVAKEAATTMRMGGGIGYDFSPLRPRGAMIKKLQSHSTGPIAFMQIFDAVCRATASAGHRRGAQMGILRVDHPSIEEFIHAKQNTDQLKGFNISVAITNEFMEAVDKQSSFNLKWNGEIYRTVDAVALWEMIMRSTFDFAEPGVIFIDTINEMNNLWYTETINSCNPCSEQPLGHNSACLLGSFNLVQYLTRQTLGYNFDADQMRADISYVVRAMDNVTDRSLYPLEKQKTQATLKRRMGLGITGLSNTAEALGYSYGSKQYLNFEGTVLSILQREAYLASVQLAKEKGSFPLYDSEKYPLGKHIQTLPEDVQDQIKRYGIRNSHLTSIAPTGTISLTADNVSSGIEPVFAYSTTRPVNTPDGQVNMTVNDYGVEFLNTKGKLAVNVTVDEHVNVLVKAQEYMDSAVSKTVNVDASIPWEDFKNVYRKVWEKGGKGCATFTNGGKRAALLTAAPTSDEAGQTCRIDSETGRRECE